MQKRTASTIRPRARPNLTGRGVSSPSGGQQRRLRKGGKQRPWRSSVRSCRTDAPKAQTPHPCPAPHETLGGDRFPHKRGPLLLGLRSLVNQPWDGAGGLRGGVDLQGGGRRIDCHPHNRLLRVSGSRLSFGSGPTSEKGNHRAGVPLAGAPEGAASTAGALTIAGPTAAPTGAPPRGTRTTAARRHRSRQEASEATPNDAEARWPPSGCVRITGCARTASGGRLGFRM